ncbi:MAG: hypothetical protein ACRCZI_03890 [Cetobacterium sp.]
MTDLYFGGKTYDEVNTDDLAMAVIDGEPNDVKKLLQHPKVYPNRLSMLIVKDICKLENIKLIIRDGRFDLFDGSAINLKLSILFNYKDATNLFLEHMGSKAYKYAVVYSLDALKIDEAFRYLEKCDFSDSDTCYFLLENCIHNIDIVKYVINHVRFNKNSIDQYLISYIENVRGANDEVVSLVLSAANVKN